MNQPILLIVLPLLALLVWGLRYFVHRSLAPQRIPETATPAEFGLHYAVVQIATANAKTLFAWFIPAPGANPAPAVVIVHGWGGNAQTMLLLARPLQAAGFATLFFDARCHGRSEDDSFASLPRFAEDLDSAVDWLRRQPEVIPEQIAVVGHSVGAAAALLVASRRRDVLAVVSIAAFSHTVSMMRRWFVSKRIPYLPVGWLLLRYVEHVIGHRFDDIAPLATVGKIGCPTLLIHGEQDSTVPVAEAHAIYAARTGGHVVLKTLVGSHDDFADSQDIETELAALVAFLKSAQAGATPCP